MGQLVPLPSLVTPPMDLKPVGTRELDNHGSHLRQMQQASDGASSGLEKSTNHDFIDVRCITAASETTQARPQNRSASHYVQRRSRRTEAGGWAVTQLDKPTLPNGQAHAPEWTSPRSRNIAGVSETLLACRHAAHRV